MSREKKRLDGVQKGDETRFHGQKFVFEVAREAKARRSSLGETWAVVPHLTSPHLSKMVVLVSSGGWRVVGGWLVAGWWLWLAVVGCGWLWLWLALATVVVVAVALDGDGMVAVVAGLGGGDGRCDGRCDGGGEVTRSRVVGMARLAFLSFGFLGSSLFSGRLVFKLSTFFVLRLKFSFFGGCFCFSSWMVFRVLVQFGLDKIDL